VRLPLRPGGGGAAPVGAAQLGGPRRRRVVDHELKPARVATEIAGELTRPVARHEAALDLHVIDEAGGDRRDARDEEQAEHAGCGQMRERLGRGDEDRVHDLQVQQIDRIAGAADQADPRRSAEGAQARAFVEGGGEHGGEAGIGASEPRHFGDEAAAIARRREGDKADKAAPAERGREVVRRAGEPCGQRLAEMRHRDPDPEIVEIVQQRIFDMQRPQRRQLQQPDIDGGGADQPCQREAFANRRQRPPDGEQQRREDIELHLDLQRPARREQPRKRAPDQIVQVERGPGVAQRQRVRRGVEAVRAFGDIMGEADDGEGRRQQEDVRRLDAQNAAAEVAFEERAAQRARLGFQRLTRQHEAADGEEQHHAGRRDLQEGAEARAAEPRPRLREEPLRPLQRMAEDDEGDGEEAQSVDLRAIDALADVAAETMRKGQQPAARRCGLGFRITHITLATRPLGSGRSVSRKR